MQIKRSSNITILRGKAIYLCIPNRGYLVKPAFICNLNAYSGWEMSTGWIHLLIPSWSPRSRCNPCKTTGNIGVWSCLFGIGIQNIYRQPADNLNLCTPGVLFTYAP